VQWEYSSDEGSLPRRGDPRHVAFLAGCSVLQLSANKGHGCTRNALTSVSSGGMFFLFAVRWDCCEQMLLLFKFLCSIPDSEFALFIWCSVEVHLRSNPVIREAPFCTLLWLSSQCQLV